MANSTLLNITSLVVIYNSSIMSSSTIKSLLAADKNGVQLKVIIWNNGPDFFDEKEVSIFRNECNSEGISFEIYQDVRNISLSYIYNFCISKNTDNDFFNILDHDSILSKGFLTNLVTNKSYELICPKVYDKTDTKVQRWPLNLSLEKIIPEGEFFVSDIFTIGSGLSISKTLITKLSAKYKNVFSEDYILYGVDGSLFSRIKELDPITGCCSGSIQHSEHAASARSKMPETAKLEYGYMYIILRLTRKKNIFKNIWFCFVYKLKTKCTFLTFFRMLHCVFTKKHPRAEFKIAPNFKPYYDNYQF